MSLKEYLNKIKKLQLDLLNFLDEETNDAGQDFFKLLNDSKICEIRKECKVFIHLIMTIVNNHHRSTNFFQKIEKILSLIQIKQNFSNSEIYELFSSNKRILLFIIQSNILSIEDFIQFSQISDKNSPENKNYPYIAYFWPEINGRPNKGKIGWPKKMISPYLTDNFEEKRKSGENETYICQLIQKDLIDEFITYVNRSNLPLSRVTIEPSIFESNSFLLDKNPSLIEYAAFYGSIQIFQYLQLNKVELNSMLWLYSIHGRNAEIIRLLEENHVDQLSYKFYEKCLRESIKCHHNEITEYIENYFESNKNDEENEEICPYCFEYYNFLLFPDDLNNQNVFNYLCEYDYASLLELYFKNTDIIDPNIKKVIRIRTLKYFDKIPYQLFFYVILNSF